MKKIVSGRPNNPLGATRPKDFTKACSGGHIASKAARRTLTKVSAHTGDFVPVRTSGHKRSLDPFPPLALLTLTTPPGGARPLTARLDRGLPTPHLHIIDAEWSQSVPVTADVVAGLADGASVDLMPEQVLPATVVYRLSAPQTSFAHSLVGRVAQDAAGNLFAEALTPRGPFFRLRLERGTEASPGDVVVATLDGQTSGIARMAGKLDDPHSALTAVCAIAADCGARFGHDPESVGEAANIRNDQRCIGPGLTELPFFTLDPKGTRVLDQAMHIERTAEGGYWLRYAIADGGALIPVDSACDKAAAERGAALYIPAQLPEELSAALHLLPEDITRDAGSLVEQKTRSALVISVKLDADCHILDCASERTVIRNIQQVTTQQVQWYYDHNMSSHLVSAPFAVSLTLLREMGQKLVHRAKGRGATQVLQAESISRTDIVAGAGNTVHTYERRDAEASQYNGLVSILVNEAVATKLAAAGVAAPFLGDTGTPRDDTQLRAKIAALGLKWPAGIGTEDFLSTLPQHDPRTVDARRLVAMHPHATAYRASPHPHSAMGLAAYTHITAPLRRYQDMVVQRITDAVLTGAGPIPYQSEAAMHAVVASANIGRDRQRLIAERSRAVRYAALLQSHVGESLPAHAVARTDFGTVVELEGSKTRILLPFDVEKPTPAIHEVGHVRVLAADIATRSYNVAWTREVPHV